MPWTDPNSEAAKQSCLERSRRYRRRKKIAKYGRRYANVNMSGRHGNHARGKKNGRWNGGRFRHSLGYIGIKVPRSHHLRQKHGYAYEHQLVAEKMLGRRLKRNEVVHHKNGKRDDNRPCNLEVQTASQHARHHTSLPGVRDSRGRFKAGVQRH